MSNETEVEVLEVEKQTKFRFRNLDVKGWPFMKLEAAVEKRWASKADGQPTKIYFHRLKVVQALAKGEAKPIRSRKLAPEQEYAGIESPFDIRRRSGYKTIWQVLAENANTIVPWDVLQREVNDRLANDPTDKTNWYSENFSNPIAKTDKKTGEVTPAPAPSEYDTRYNAIVISRAPYNGILPDGTVKERSIEGLKQRVIISDEGPMLMTNVTEPREFKQRGRKPKQPKVNEVVEDNDKSEVFESSNEEVVEEVVETPLAVNELIEVPLD